MNTTAARPRLRAFRHWRQWLLVLAAVGVIVLLRQGQLDLEERSAPFQQRASGLDRVAGRNFAIDVKGFKVAGAYLVAGDYGDPQPRRLSTPGVWLSLVATVEALQQPGLIGARLRTRDGRLYAAAPFSRPYVKDVNLDARTVAPGLPETGAWFFELPPDKLQGAHLQVFWGSRPQGMDSLVDIDLGIDAVRARELLHQAPPILDLRGKPAPATP